MQFAFTQTAFTHDLSPQYNTIIYHINFISSTPIKYNNKKTIHNGREASIILNFLILFGYIVVVYMLTNYKYIM